METDERILALEKRVAELEAELEEKTVRLKKYTAPQSRKVYYEKHREEELQRAKKYRERTVRKKPTPEQVKRYNTTARAKLKLKKEMEMVGCSGVVYAFKHSGTAKELVKKCDEAVEAKRKKNVTKVLVGQLGNLVN